MVPSEPTSPQNDRISSFEPLLTIRSKIIAELAKAEKHV
jgi:hypothetical protein